MFCSLKNPRSIATKYGSEDAVGNTPTFTLSCATAAGPEPVVTGFARVEIPPGADRHQAVAEVLRRGKFRARQVVTSVAASRIGSGGR